MIMGMATTPNTQHETPAGGFGLPYARAGVDAGKATATCPRCGEVCKGSTPKAAARAYADHFLARNRVEFPDRPIR
jgi:hypothetical protein